MLIKVLLLLCGVMAITGVIQYIYYSVNMQAGANRFVFTLGFTVLLAAHGQRGIFLEKRRKSLMDQGKIRPDLFQGKKRGNVRKFSA